MIAATHRCGFMSGEGKELRILRLAQVSVYSESLAHLSGLIGPERCVFNEEENPHCRH